MRNTPKPVGRTSSRRGTLLRTSGRAPTLLKSAKAEPRRTRVNMNSKRIAGLVSAAAMSAALALPSAASAVFEDVVASPDGRHVYGSGEGTEGFNVDPVSGALRPIPGFQQGSDNGLGGRLVLSPDGRFAYLGSRFVGVGGMIDRTYGSIHILSRDAGTGILTHEESLFGGPWPGSSGLGPVLDIELSPDGRHLYALERAPAAVRVFERDAKTGRLNQAQVLHAAEGMPDGDTWQMALSPDGRHLYTAGYHTAVFARDGDGGRLALVETVPASSSDIAVSPDGQRVYAGESDYTVWSRDPATGKLKYLSWTYNEKQECAQASACERVLLGPSPDGHAVYSSYGGRLFEASTADGRAKPARSYGEGDSPGSGRRAYPSAMGWSVDGREAYVAIHGFGFSPAHDAQHAGPLTPNVQALARYRVTDAGLQFLEYAPPTTGEPSQWYPEGSIAINDGDRYTNDPNVRVAIKPPFTAMSLKLSNTAGDFSASETLRLGPGAVRYYEWRLDTRTPGDVKTVHVRFVPTGPVATELADDIIVLDQRRPEVSTASISGARLRVKARDNRSGVKRIQVTRDPARPGKSRKFKSAVELSGAPRRVYVRVLDGAGNRSKWRVARPR